MLTTLNKGLEKLTGFRLVRTQRHKSPWGLGKATNNLVVEFMGPSGVGKTTLRDYYLKHHKFSFQNEVITEKEVKNYHFNLEEFKSENEEIYQTLFASKLKKISETKDSFIKTHRRLNLFYDSLKIDFVIRNYLSDTIVFMDQHVFKFFANDFIHLKETELKQEFLQRRIIIYCKASPETIIDYIEKRKQAGSTRPVHKQRDSKQLHHQLQEHLAAREKDVQTLQQNGAHLLEINTEKSLAENTKLIDEFMTEYFKNQQSI